MSTNPATGLSSAEARRRLSVAGPNLLVPGAPLATLRRWLRTLADPMIGLLVVAAAVNFLLGEARDAWVLIVSIAPILLVDSALEARTGKALRKIRELMRPAARVVRDGREQQVPSEELVPGDLLLLKEGDILPADGALVEASNLEVDEAPLTGESIPVAKEVSPPEAGRVYAGTSILSGYGKAVIGVTGAGTRYGQIGHTMAGIKEERTPLQQKIGALVGRLALGAVVACAGLFGIEMARGAGWGKSLLAAVSLAIAAVPEEFPIVFSLYLTMGVWRLARREALVRRMVGVETLGATTVICADKTGTLTEGHLSVAAHPGGENDPLFWESIVLACEPSPTDPLERALVEHAREHGVPPEPLYAEWRLVQDHPFDRGAKYMSHVWRSASGEMVICAKGAVEGIAACCAMPAQQRRGMDQENRKLAGTGMRVIAVAAGRLERLSTSRAENERSLRYLGLVGFNDPPRAEVARSIAVCREAGVRVVMVTGDHPLTAHHIAETIGLEHEDDQVVTGPELEAMDDEELARRAARANIFARVLPDHKHRLVLALKRRGEIVAMTGDGINDALALKEAHIGVAMGRRSTEVARAAATMVLLDDNFQTIVEAVREGRQVFSKIEKAFRYLITFHTPIVLLAVAAPLLDLPLLMLPVIIIWLELIMHPTVALVFETDPGDPLAMRRPPRDPRRAILPARELLTSVATGVSIGAGILALYAYQLGGGAAPAAARAVALCSLVLAEMFLVTIELSRSRMGAAIRNVFFWVTRALTLGVLLVFLYVPPMTETMQLAPVGAAGWLEAVGVAGVTTIWVEAVLYLRRRNAGP